MRHRTTKPPLKIALTYAIVASLYIMISDKLAGTLALTTEALTKISVLKGLMFVALTSLMLYLMVRRLTNAQNRVQEELAKSNERLALITSTTPVFLFEIDRTGAILHATKPFQGIPMTDILSTNFFSFLPEHRRGALAAVIEATCATATAQSFEYTTRADGQEPRTFSLTIAPLHHRNNSPHLLVTVHDITDQKQKEDALRQSHQRFELVSRASNDTIWDWDIVSGKLWVSDAFFQKYGYPRTTSLTLSDWDSHIHPEDRERVVKSRLTAVQQRATSWEEEFRFVHANGSTSYVVDRGFLVFDDQGTPVRMICSMVDVTTLKLAELDQRYLAEERQKLLHQLRLQFERMPVGYVLADRNFRIVEWNPSCEKIFGYTRAEVIGRSPFDVVIPSVLKPFIDEFIDRLKTGKETLTAINENLTKDGRTILCEWFDTPLFDEYGNYTGMIAMVQDITERRHAEEELKKSNIQLRNLSAYLQTVREQERKHIAREIHDELGQELTALKMQAALMQKAIAKLDAAAPKSELLDLTHSLTVMADTAIKTVRRIATELRPDVLDKVGLIDALKWQAQEFEKRTGVQCIFRSRVDEWDFPDDVATALFRIFQEALTNVSRHARATRVAAELSLREDWVDFRVEDNGRGISEEQIENTSSLGLIGLVERAKLLSGTATIVGVPGAGTTINVHIPLPSSNAENGQP